MALRWQPASTENLERKEAGLRDSKIAGYYYGFLGGAVLPLLHKAAITPNQLTILGLFFALLVPAGFFFHPWYGFAFMLLSGMADTLDGQLSRVQGNGSAFGAFLDSTLDRAADFLFLGGFWVLFWGGPRFLLATGLLAAAMFFTFLISYAKARAEGLGSSCQEGLMGRAPRTIYLLLWAFLVGLLPAARQPLLWGGLALYGALTAATLVERLVRIGRRLRGR
ncbi:MAG: CDP-alcohol phosphatidyltransferase family protein [Desulfobacteraceae bacterium]|nr:CDP-alcohol phosphatidyltransferase family protein [Desulfobacteraceae bacterium]